MLILRVLTAVILAFGMTRAASAHADDELVGGLCPRKIEVARQRLAHDVPGWQVMIDDVPHLLANVSFTEDHPSKQTPVHPESGDDWKARKRSYRLDRSGLTHWVVCEYMQTTVLLFRQLDPKLGRCDLLLDPDVQVSGFPKVLDIRCR